MFQKFRQSINGVFHGYQGPREQTQIGTGSGVIITEDGYIVTNNHVIQDTTELEVTLTTINRTKPNWLEPIPKWTLRF